MDDKELFRQVYRILTAYYLLDLSWANTIYQLHNLGLSSDSIAELVSKVDAGNWIPTLETIPTLTLA